MEALSLSPRRLSREEIIAGVGGSILGHALILGAALLLPAMMPRSTTPLVFATVNLVSMNELGGSGTVSPQGGKSTKTEGVKEVKGSEGSAPSRQSRPSSPLVPVKRLRMEDSAPREPSIKKLDAPQIAGTQETVSHLRPSRRIWIS